MLQETLKEIELPSGYTTRPATFADIPAITDLINLCAVTEIGKSDSTVQELEGFYQTPGFDPATNTRLTFNAAGKLVGYHDVDDTQPIPVKIHAWGRTHPDFEGLGIGTAAMIWAENRARQTFTRLPADLHVVLHCHTFSTNSRAAHLLQDQGMALVRHYWQMTIELDQPQPQPVWPAGIRLTTFSEYDDLAAIYRAKAAAFQDHWGVVAEPEEAGLARFRHWLESDEEFEPGLWYLALAGDEIAGFSLCRRRSYEDEEMGWVSLLGVRRDWRKQGLALALLQHSFNAFHQRGKKQVSLGVDAGSLTGATRLYEKAGMHVSRQTDLYQKVLRDGKDLATTAVED